VINIFFFRTNESTCFLRVNDFSAIDNTTSSTKVISAGFNFTAFLENGINHIELLMAAKNHEEPKSLSPDATCELIITKDTEYESTEIANFKLSVDENGEITARDSIVHDKVKNEVRILEGYTKNENDYGFYKIRGVFILKDCLNGLGWMRLR